ncbi:MAG: NYN domain-containing protein [Acidobacteriota bacterium]|nr:MAG: NYN domain-containing protein [Acidobacteriota bacterium]
MSEPLSPVLIDGYNVLIYLAEREHEKLDGDRLPRARERLLGLLDEWATARSQPVVVVWDGRGSPAAGRGELLRVVFVEPPAEADDWIVLEAERLHAAGRAPIVVTRDRGLRSRLPAGCGRLGVRRLAADLDALADGPLSAPHISGPRGARGPIPVSTGPVDTSRLPRRRRPPAVPSGSASEQLPRPVAVPQARTEDGPARPQQARRQKKARWERAQARRQARRTGRRKKCWR